VHGVNYIVVHGVFTYLRDDFQQLRQYKKLTALGRDKQWAVRFSDVSS